MLGYNDSQLYVYKDNWVPSPYIFKVISIFKLPCDRKMDGLINKASL